MTPVKAADNSLTLNTYHCIESKYLVPINNFEDLSMSVVYDNNVLNPIRGQQAGASHRRLCCIDSAGSLPQLDIYVSMTTDMEDRVYPMS